MRTELLLLIIISDVKNIILYVCITVYFIEGVDYLIAPKHELTH